MKISYALKSVLAAVTAVLIPVAGYAKTDASEIYRKVTENWIKEGAHAGLTENGVPCAVIVRKFGKNTFNIFISPRKDGVAGDLTMTTDPKQASVAKLTEVYSLQTAQRYGPVFPEAFHVEQEVGSSKQHLTRDAFDFIRLKGGVSVRAQHLQKNEEDSYGLIQNSVSCFVSQK